RTGARDDETRGEDDETTGEGDETAGDGDGDEPQPCEWTNFPVQYGIGDLGQSCGALHDDATQEDIDLVLACLEEAYDAEAAAFGTLSWSDPVSNFYKVSWYVRPPGEGGPRRFETRWFQAIAEEGPYPPPNMNVYSCTAFAKNDDCSYFPDSSCSACVGGHKIPCEN